MTEEKQDYSAGEKAAHIAGAIIAFVIMTVFTGSLFYIITGVDESLTRVILNIGIYILIGLGVKDLLTVE